MSNLCHLKFYCFKFITDGADIILTNTYQASVEGYMEYLDLNENQSIELIKESVRLAQFAKSKYIVECHSANLQVKEGLRKDEPQ